MSDPWAAEAFARALRHINAALGVTQMAFDKFGREIAQQRLLCPFCQGWHRPGLPMQVHQERAHGIPFKRGVRTSPSREPE